MTTYRKQIRLPDFDYASVGAYFVTICTVDKRNILSKLPTGVDHAVRPCIVPTYVGADDPVRPSRLPVLTELGRMVETCIHGIPTHSVGVRIDNYVIMPNHVHLLLQITAAEGGQSRPPLQKIVQSFKSVTTRKAWDEGLKKLWQRSFYDHVIRNDADYRRIWEYIEHNPLRWSEDIFFEASE